tara:strand:- start:2326 stop:3294 length:969 start_codon:yes stop_codon:yes gene_type:complete
MIKNKIFNIVKNLVILFCILYLIHEVYKNFDYIESKFNNNKLTFLFIILIGVIHLNVLSLRNYQIYKICAKYAGKFYDWSQIYYESLILNILVSHTGSVYRAVETKKRGLEYKKYAGIFYMLFCSYILINVFLVMIELIFIPEASFQFKLNLLLIFLLLSLFIFFSPKIGKTLIEFNFIKKIIYKNKICKKIVEAYELIYLFMKTQTFLKKTIYYLLGYGILIHIIEILIFYMSSLIIQPDITLKTLLILFGVNFILDRIPLISNVPGINEILFAGVGIAVGLFFYEALILKIILRVNLVITTFLNYIIYYILNLKHSVDAS